MASITSYGKLFHVSTTLWEKLSQCFLIFVLQYFFCILTVCPLVFLALLGGKSLFLSIVNVVDDFIYFDDVSSQTSVLKRG